MVPALVLGRFRPVLVATAAGDALKINRSLPSVVRGLVPFVVIALAIAFAGSHASRATAYNPQDVDWLRLQIDTTFTEVPLFLILACVIGAWAPSAGILFVTVYGILDLGAASLDRWEMSPLPAALVARLVAVWLLWLLVVEIPIVGRALARSLRQPIASRLVIALVAAVVTGALTWAWTQAAPVLLRPLYLWSSIGDIERSAIMPVQLAGSVFAIVAGVAAAARAWFARPEELLDERAVPVAAPRPPRPRAISIARQLVAAALLTIALGGLVTTPLDAVTLFVALAGAAPLARITATRTPVGLVLRQLPPLARAALAAGLAYGVALLMVGGIIPTWHGPSEFFSVIGALAVALFLVRLVIYSREPGAASDDPRPIAAGATIALVLLGLSVIAPARALADNCASFADCWATPLLAALVGGALAPLLAMNDFSDWLDKQLKYWSFEERDRRAGLPPPNFIQHRPFSVRPSGASWPNDPGQEGADPGSKYKRYRDNPGWFTRFLRWLSR
jgi:hypothetical protein